MKLFSPNLWSGASAVAATTILLLSAAMATPARAADAAIPAPVVPAQPRVSVVTGATALNASDKAAIDGGLAGCTTTTTHYYVWVPMPGIVTVLVPVEYARVERTVCD